MATFGGICVYQTQSWQFVGNIWPIQNHIKLHTVSAIPHQKFFFLIIYSTDIEYHQNAIYSVKRRGGDRASVPAVMAQHLFSQLIPGNKYCINNRSKNLPNVCPCQQPNCGKEIKAGCTALGTCMFSNGMCNCALVGQKPCYKKGLNVVLCIFRPQNLSFLKSFKNKMADS